MRLGRVILEWIIVPIVLENILGLLPFLVPIVILGIWFRKEVKFFLRSFIIFICITVILCCLLYMVSKYIPGTDKFLTDSSGRFNLGVISMLVAGVSFLAGIEEREKLKKRELELEKKKWIYKAFCDYRAEWEFIVDSYKKVNSFLISEFVIQRSENKEIKKQKDKILDESIETEKKSKNESEVPDIKLRFLSVFSDRTEIMSYYSKIDTYKLNKTHYELRLLVDIKESKSEVEDCGGDRDIIKESMDFIDITKNEMDVKLNYYFLGSEPSIEKFRKFHKWYRKNNKTKKDIKEKLDSYAAELVKETLEQ